jgi:hypothetical protein
MAESNFAVDSSANGRLYVYVIREPDPRTFPGVLANNDHLSSLLTGHEWTALFFNELKCPSARLSLYQR